MKTERYIINFYSIGKKKFCVESVRDLWAAEAEKEFENCGVFVGAVVEETYLVCNPQKGCEKDSRGMRFVLIRNPVLDFDPNEYFKAVRSVVLGVKQKLNNPPVGICVFETDYFFFDII